MCLIEYISEKRIIRKRAKLQEQMDLENEFFTQKLQELKEELIKEIQSLEFLKIKEELDDRIDKIEIILSNKIATD